MGGDPSRVSLTLWAELSFVFMTGLSLAQEVFKAGLCF